MSRKALGRGLDALIPRPEPRDAEPGRLGPQAIPISQIVPNPRQPRRKSDPTKLDELVQSIRIHGVIEPLIVRRNEGRVELIAGERRLRAAKQAELQEVPVLFVDADDLQSFEMALIENVQREDLNPVDEARAYQIMAGEFRRTHDQIAEQVGKSRTAVTNLLRLLRLPQDLLALVADGRISPGHARALLATDDLTLQRRVASKIVAKQWSVRQVERILNRRERGGPRARTAKDPHHKRVEEAIRRRVGTEVRLHVNKQGGGKVELLCADREDLERLLEILGVRVY